MGFFEELGDLMKKYNLEIHTVQIDENIRIMNERFRLALRKEDLPPPLLLFRTSEGDFVPSLFGPLTLNNEEHNIKFTNIKDGSSVVLFPIEEKKEETEMEKKVADTLNKLSDTLENNAMNWEVVEPEKKEEEIDMKRSKKDKYLIIGNIFNETGKEVVSYGDFISKHIDTLQHFDTLTSLYNTNVNGTDTVELKLTTKAGKEAVKKIEEAASKFKHVVVLEDYKKSNFAKRIVKDLQANGMDIIEEKDF